MNDSIYLSDLRPIASRPGGLAALKRAILSGREVLCICVIACAYYVGWRDARGLLIAACGEDGPLQPRHMKSGEEFREDTVFVPRSPPQELADAINEKAEVTQARVDWVYEVLVDAYSGYQTGKRLHDQDPAIHDQFIAAFSKLQGAHLVPEATRYSEFNHQGMLLIMAECFPDRDTLVRYLKDPAILRLPELPAALSAPAAGHHDRQTIAAFLSESDRICDRLDQLIWERRDSPDDERLAAEVQELASRLKELASFEAAARSQVAERRKLVSLSEAEEAFRIAEEGLVRFSAASPPRDSSAG